jgi:hypothetical protein
MKTILLTAGFGRRNFQEAATRLARNAEKSGLFNEILIENNHSLQNLHTGFLNSHKEFLFNENNRRGFGHYLWKPYIINYWLERIPDNDILVFLDAGCHINYRNPRARDRFSDYLKITSENDGLAMQLRDNSFGYDDLSEKRWTRLDLMEHLGVPKEMRVSNQIQSGIIFLKKGESTLTYTSTWMKLATYDGCLFLDDSRIVSANNLIESRWEQSIHSLLFKKYKFGVLPDETTFGEQWPPNWEILGKKFPIWAMRHRSGVDPTRFLISDLGMRIRDKFSK